MKKVFRFSAFILFFLIVITGMWCEDIGIDGFIEKYHAEFRWDPLRDTGELKIDNNIFSFKVGSPWVVYNYKEKISNTGAFRRKGEIILGSESVRSIEAKLDKEAAIVTAEADRSLISTGHRIAAILIDPGHGGRDPGAIGRHTNSSGGNLEIFEKDIVLNVSLKLQDLLKKRYRDKQILLTRSNDSYPSLESRVEKANNIKLGKNEAIVFVSVHANASFNKNARGFEVWYLPPEYRRDLIDVNTLDKSYQDIIPILNTMLEEEYTIESILLASYILEGLDGKVGTLTPNRGLKEETWFVVRNAKMPSVLIELGFVSNKDESMLLKEDSYLKKLAEGIYTGIIRFIENLETINTDGAE